MWSLLKARLRRARSLLSIDTVIFRYVLNAIIKILFLNIETAILCESHHKPWGYDCIIANHHLTNGINR